MILRVFEIPEPKHKEFFGALVRALNNDGGAGDERLAKVALVYRFANGAQGRGVRSSYELRDYGEFDNDIDKGIFVRSRPVLRIGDGFIYRDGFFRTLTQRLGRPTHFPEDLSVQKLNLHYFVKGSHAREFMCDRGYEICFQETSNIVEQGQKPAQI